MLWTYHFLFFKSSFFFKLTLFRYRFLKGVPYRHLASWIPFIHNLNFAAESLNREGEKDFKEKREGLFALHAAWPCNVAMIY